MLSPADLLEQAEVFSSRIPAGPEYVEDRNSSWLAIGEAWLKLQDGGGALRALGHLDHPRCRAVLVHAIAMWTGEHPEFEPGRELLRCVTDQIPNLFRSEATDLVLPLLRVLGKIETRELIGQIENAPLKCHMLVTYSHFLRDREERREALEAAEQLAVTDDDRVSVTRGYRTAGLEFDRVASLEATTFEKLFAEAESVLSAATEVLAQQAPHPPPDSQAARLGRFLRYKFNDLKVRFLVDSALAGGIADQGMERLLLCDAFSKIESPRAPSIYRDPSELDLAAFADFFFARPVALDERDRELLEGLDHFEDYPSRTNLQPRANELFQHFGTIAPRYSAEQIEQGLWLLIGGRFQVPDFDETMYFPFRDYYAGCGDSYEGSVFYMWWDLIRPGPKALPVLEKIIALPSAACQRAALHGLNHMHPEPGASEVVKRYIEENRDRLTPEELEYAEECRDGRAQ